MTFPTEQQHWDAVAALLTAANARPYDIDAEVPALSAYTLLTVTDRFGGNLRLTGQIGIRGVRVTCVYLGETADNAREMRKRGEAALREQVVTVGAYESTPIQFEAADPVAPDGSPTSSGQWYAARSDYTYSV